MDDSGRRGVTHTILLCCLLCVTFCLYQIAPVEAQSPRAELTLTVPGATEMAWSPDGTYIAIAAESSIGLYTPRLELMTRLQEHTGIVRSLAWNPDGSRLASGSEDATVRIWDMTPGNTFGAEVAAFYPGGLDVMELAWSPVLGDNRLAISAFDRIVETMDGGLIAYTVEIWDTLTDSVTQVGADRYYDVWSLAWSPDGEVLATSGSTVGDQGYALCLWQSSSGQALGHTANAVDWKIYDTDWSPATNTLAVALNVGVWLFDGTTDVLITSLPTRIANTSRVSWSSDGSLLASANSEGEISIWDAPRAREIIRFPAHDGYVWNLAWNPEGTTLASFGSDETIRLWDMNALPASSDASTITPYPTATAYPNAKPTTLPSRICADWDLP